MSFYEIGPVNGALRRVRPSVARGREELEFWFWSWRIVQRGTARCAVVEDSAVDSLGQWRVAHIVVACCADSPVLDGAGGWRCASSNSIYSLLIFRSKFGFLEKNTHID
ncbi:hypothetical protein A2U01_0060750, partial [Trifolium medium]|nr:hypothetical protein [Trifolium medium]